MKIIDIIEDGYAIGKENRNGIFCKKWNIWRRY